MLTRLAVMMAGAGRIERCIEGEPFEARSNNHSREEDNQHQDLHLEAHEHHVALHLLTNALVGRLLRRPLARF